MSGRDEPDDYSHIPKRHFNKASFSGCEELVDTFMVEALAGLRLSQEAKNNQIYEFNNQIIKYSTDIICGSSYELTLKMKPQISGHASEAGKNLMKIMNSYFYPDLYPESQVPSTQGEYMSEEYSSRLIPQKNVNQTETSMTRIRCTESHVIMGTLSSMGTIQLLSMYVALNQIGGLTFLKERFSRISDEIVDRQMWFSMIRENNSVNVTKKEDIKFRKSTEKIRTSTLFDTLMVSVCDGISLYDLTYRYLKPDSQRLSSNTQIMCCMRCGLRMNLNCL